MTPEKEITALIGEVCKDSGHWPYTRDSDLYIGFRPGPESFTMAGNHTVRVQVRYDIVICAQRGGLALEMEKMRFQLYAKLMGAGWQMDGDPGPETYDAKMKRFLWPLSCVKSFAISAEGRPVNPAAIRNGGA